LEDDPYRSVSEPYFELNALGEIHFGAVSIFVNAINLTNVRQTRFDPLLRTTPGLGGTPITHVGAAGRPHVQFGYPGGSKDLAGPAFGQAEAKTSVGFKADRG
jgi:hypothetical protein